MHNTFDILIQRPCMSVLFPIISTATSDIMDVLNIKILHNVHVGCLTSITQVWIDPCHSV